MLMKLTEECHAAPESVSRIFVSGESVCVVFADGETLSIHCDYGKGVYATFNRVVSEINKALMEPPAVITQNLS